jgi:hypothetical protein
MTANRIREFYHDPDEYHPFEQWFYRVSELADMYPPEAMAELYYEIECATLGKEDVDNLFVSKYNETNGNFLLEVPDD